MFQHMLRDDTVEIAGMSLLPPDTAKEALPVLLEATADRFATLLKNPATTDALIKQSAQHFLTSVRLKINRACF